MGECIVKRVLVFVTFLLVLPNAFAESYNLPLDSLSEWTGEKTVSVVSNVSDLDNDTEFLALLGRLSVKGFDVNFDHPGLSGEGLILEVLEVQDKLAISIKSGDSQKYLFSTLVDQAGQVIPSNDTYPSRILPLPLDFKPKRVTALPMSARENSRLVFLSDTKLVLGSLKADNIHMIDERPSNIKDSKAIYLSVGQVDSDPNPEVAVVWGQDRDISGKGQYTKIYSQLFEISEKGLGQESERKEDVAIRFIDNELYAQQFELLNGGIGKPMAASLTDGNISIIEEISSLPADQDIFSIFPVGDSEWIVVSESYLELQTLGQDSFARLELGKVSSPKVAKRLMDREVISSPDYAYSVNEKYLSIPRKVVVEGGKVITFVRKRRSAFAGLSSASGSDVMVSASWDSDSSNSGFSLTPIREIESFLIDFSQVKTEGESSFLVLTNEEDDSQGASHMYIY